jgi:DtxR family Mn-dependent transcriptional regulator
MPNSFTEENYLKAIYRLSERNELVTTSDIAVTLNIRAATVTDMLKKLAERKFIRYERYHGVSLTEKGKQAGIRIIRKHRLWELFLVQKMNFRWDEVHEIAEQLEHIRSDELIDRLDAMLGHPKYDPHGDPIPDRNGMIGKTKSVPLLGVRPGVLTQVMGVADTSDAFLKHLDKLGIALGAKIVIGSVEPYDQSHRISVNQGKEISVSESVARNILVTLK